VTSRGLIKKFLEISISQDIPNFYILWYKLYINFKN